MQAAQSKYVAVASLLMILGAAPVAIAGQATPYRPAAATPGLQSAAALLEPRWLPWLGCWELVADAVDYREVDSVGRRVVCVTPRPDGLGVTMTTHLDGAVVGQDIVLADGQDHPTQERGCQGWQRSVWSADGQRLYNEAQATCGGGTDRTLAGVNMLVEGGRWLELQSISLYGGEHREIVIRHYQRLADNALADFGFVSLPLDVSIAAATARAAVSGPLDVDDVREINERLPLEITEAAILESDSQFELSSKELIKLADSGVEDRVIDLMVAVSFPDRFVVDTGAGGGSGGGYGRYGGYGGYRGFGGYAGFGGYGPSCYGSVWGPYYSPFYGPFYGSFYGSYAPLSCGSRYYDPYYRGGYYGSRGGSRVSIGVPKRGSLYGGRVLLGRGYARVQAKPEPVDGNGSAFRRRLFGIRDGSSGGRFGSSSPSAGSAQGSVGPSGFSKGAKSGSPSRSKGASKGSARPRGGKGG